MANWTNRPNIDPNQLPYRIHRCPATKSIRGIIVSDQLIGTNLHYWKGRSTPCTADTCTACMSGHQPRWKGYFQLKSADSRTIQIVEVTDRVFGVYDDARRLHGSLRGLGTTITRVNGKINGPLSAVIDGMKASPGELPEEANLTEILERMWEHRQDALPGMDSEEDPKGKPQMRVHA